MTFGEMLKHIRENHGYGVRELGRMMGEDSANICKYEKGYFPPPSPKIIDRFVRALKMDRHQKAALYEAARDWHLDRIREKYEL